MSARIPEKDVMAALIDIDSFVRSLGDSPMGGQHIVARNWAWTRELILTELVGKSEPTRGVGVVTSGGPGGATVE